MLLIRDTSMASQLGSRAPSDEKRNGNDKSLNKASVRGGLAGWPTRLSQHGHWQRTRGAEFGVSRSLALAMASSAGVVCTVWCGLQVRSTRGPSAHRPRHGNGSGASRANRGCVRSFTAPCGPRAARSRVLPSTIGNTRNRFSCLLALFGRRHPSSSSVASVARVGPVTARLGKRT